MTNIINPLLKVKEPHAKSQVIETDEKLPAKLIRQSAEASRKWWPYECNRCCGITTVFKSKEDG